MARKKQRVGWPIDPRTDPMHPFFEEPAYRRKPSARVPQSTGKRKDKRTLGQIKHQYRSTDEDGE